MIKGFVNWIYTERLIEMASYILEKKEKKKTGKRTGTLNPVCEGICAT